MSEHDATTEAQRCSKSDVERIVNPITLIAQERQRQKEVEGWTTEHDDKHKDQSLAMAASLYASPTDDLERVTYCDQCQHPYVTDPWPWLDEIEPPRGGPMILVHAWDKRETHSRMRRLQIAGALIVAEMERLQRAEG